MEIILTLQHFPSAKIAKRTFGKSRFLRFKNCKNTSNLYQKKVPSLARDKWQPSRCRNEAHDSSLEIFLCLLSGATEITSI